MPPLSKILKKPFETGAIAPSSRRVARRIVEAAGVARAERVVELGPGNGVITERIFDALPPRGRFLAIERCRESSERLAGRFGRDSVVCGCASHLQTHAEAAGVLPADSIVSALPWSNLPCSTRERIIDSVFQALAPGGIFVTVVCFGLHWLPPGRHLRDRLLATFAHVEPSPVILANVPPAFLYVCRR